MPIPRRIITEVPGTVAYDMRRLEAQKSFGATFAEAVSQIEEAIRVRLTCDTIADIIGSEFPPESMPMPEGKTVKDWLNRGYKPASVEGAKAAARALRIPEEYFTRFYKS